WSATDKSSVVCARGPNLVGDGSGQILLHVRNTGQRHSTGTRRASSASGRRFGFGLGQEAGVASRQSESAFAGGGGGGGRGCIQYAPGGCAFCAGGSGR